MIRAVLAAVMLAALTTPVGAEPGRRLQSGVYEGLELVVAQNGAVAASFTRDTDTPPHRICAFSFTGHLRPDGAAAAVVVRSPQDGPSARPINATLTATGDGIALKADGVTAYPACDQLVATDPKAGLEFSRIAPADGAWLGIIASSRAQMHLAPTGTAWRGYLVKDDYVALGVRQGDRWQAVYLSPAGRRAKGWLDAADLHLFPHR